MPHIKNALIRYRVIDRMLTHQLNKYPSKLDLRQACEEELYGDTVGEHISESTIEKDLFAMREEMDAPIAYSIKYRGYYYTDTNFSINEQPLTDDDRASIQFALSTLSQFKQTDLFKQFGNALNKVIDRININLNDHSQNKLQYIQFEKGVAGTGNEYITPLLVAIESGYITYFSYESFVTQIKKTRKVTPLLLKEYKNRWYLISFDLVKNKVITYALDRISELDATNQKGDKPLNFNSDRYFKYAVGITASEEAKPEQIVLTASNIAAKYIASRPFHQSQNIISATENATEFSFFALVSEELIREILSYGGDVKIIAPDSLRTEVLSRIKKMYGNYE